MTPQFIMRIGGALYLKSKLNDAGQYVPQHPDAKWDTLEYQQRSIESEIECLRWSPGYAEPGYTDSKKGVLFANWNYFDNRTCNLLEKYGYETEWSDEWDQCENCQKAVRHSPDSYCWQPSFVLVGECTILCTKCFKEMEETVEEQTEEEQTEETEKEN